MKINVSPNAQNDVIEINRYIKRKLGNPIAATSITNKIKERIERIAKFPRYGVPVGPLLGIETNYRFVVCKNYKIFYRIEWDDIYVDRVLHDKQDYMKLLFGKKRHS